jgi:hypothetical protein
MGFVGKKFESATKADFANDSRKLPAKEMPGIQPSQHHADRM